MPKSIKIKTDLVQKDESDELFTTSLLVAKKFEKRHDTVIRKISKLKKETFTRLNIAVSEYMDESGKSNKMYLLNRDAFLFVSMGFTGEKAEEWKLDFIDAFNKMEAIIKRHTKNIRKKNWEEIRREAAVESKLMGSTLQEVRKLSGKETKGFHYANEHKLVNFAMTGEFKKLNREGLTNQELKILTALEIRNTVLLGVGKPRDERKAALVLLHDEMETLLLDNKEAA